MKSMPEERPESTTPEHQTWVDRHWNACRDVALGVFFFAMFSAAFRSTSLLALIAEFLVTAVLLVFVVLFVIGLVLPKSWLEKITPSAKR